MKGGKIKNHSIVILIYVTCCFNIAIVSAQHRLSGRLVEGNGRPLSGASVILSRGDSLAAGAMSDREGKFLLERLPAGDYVVTFSMLGYRTVERAVSLAADRYLGRIAMEEEAYALGEVTVTGDERNRIDTRAGGSTFRISNQLRESARNVYQALREIPLLNVNETERSIKMADGSKPIILINGVRRTGMEDAIDPRQIEAIEVIENPSARYLAEEGTTSVLNIRLKRSVELSRSVSLYGNQMPEGTFGVYGGNFQLEKEKLSFYLNGMFFYFQDDESEIVNQTNTGTLRRSSAGPQRYDARNLWLSAGGDWVVSEKDYLSYSLTFLTNPAEIQTDETGTCVSAEGSSPYAVSSYTKENYLTGNYALFYRRTFAPDRHLELTARASHYNTSPSGWREEAGDRYAYRNEIDMDNHRMVYSLESNYDFTWPERMAFDVGLNAYYQQASLKENQIPFDYKEGREYLYASLRGLGKGRFSYALSLGLDIVERSSAGARKNYVNVLPSLTLAYETHKGGTLRLAYNRQRVSPSLSYLNPLNTSTDSLYVIEGNPYLAPELSECVTLSYAWNKSPVYLQPSVSYTYARDRVLAVGSLRGDIYTRSYLNAGHAHDWRFALTARVNLGKYGNINVTPYFRKQDLPGMAFSGESWGMSGNVYLAYKKLWLNGMFNYTSYNYGSVVRTHSTPMTEITVGWQLPKGWSVSVGVRDNMRLYRSWTRDGDYTSYTEIDFKERRWTPMVGLSYYFRNKADVKNRAKKRLYDNEGDSFKLIQIE